MGSMVEAEAVDQIVKTAEELEKLETKEVFENLKTPSWLMSEDRVGSNVHQSCSDRIRS